MPLALEPSGAFRFVRAPYLSTIDEEDAGAAPAAPPTTKNAVAPLPSVSAPPEPTELPFLRVFLKYRDESGAVLRNAVGVPSSEAVVPHDSQTAAPSVPDDIYRLALRISKKVATLSTKSFEELMCFSRFGKLLVLEGDHYALELTALDHKTLAEISSYVDALRAEDRRKAGKKRNRDDLSDVGRARRSAPPPAAPPPRGATRRARAAARSRVAFRSGGGARAATAGRGAIARGEQRLRSGLTAWWRWEGGGAAKA